MDAPRRGNEHIARGRAKRHPGNNTIVHTRPERAKALIIRYLQFMYCVCYAFALALSLQKIATGRGDCRCLIPVVPLRSAPGYVLIAPLGRVHSMFGR